VESSLNSSGGHKNEYPATGNWEKRLGQYGKGLTIIRADQCPYSVKNVREISETAKKIYGILLGRRLRKS